MFADLVGNTALAERLDAEEMRRVLTHVFDALAREVVGLDGTIDKYIGDEVMAVFGAPVAHEDDANRAITAGMRMQQAMERLNPDLEQRYGAKLALRVGINSGEVVAGVLAPNVQTAYTVVGDTVNVAKRFAQAAEPGEILLGATTHRLARGFNLETRPPMTAKGKAAPIQVFSVHSISTGPSSALPLIGRREEASAVRGVIERLLHGTGSALAIVGEAGIGKSRLIEHTREIALRAHVVWLEGHAVEHARHISYSPFRELLRDFAMISDQDDDPTKLRKLGSRVEDLLGPSATETLLYLALLGGIRSPMHATQHFDALDAEALRRQVLRAAYVFFEELAKRGPAVLALEDLHWADDSSRQLLEHLLPLTDRLLICWTERPSRAEASSSASGTARSARAYVEIDVAPLADVECGELVSALAGTRALDASSRSHIVKRAAGNPFFAQELVRTSLDLPVSSLPHSIRASITSRLDALPSATRNVARAASIVGRTFSSRLLRTLVAPTTDISLAMGELARHNLIRATTVADDRDFAFTHSLVQEAVYAGIVIEERRRLHGLVATQLERLATSPEETAGTLAYHYTQAENWEKAQAYLFTLGDQALRIAADVEALEHYERALRAYERAFGSPSDLVARATVERKIGEARSRLGDFALATKHLDLALATLHSRRPSNRAGVRAGIVRELVVQSAHRVGLVRHAREAESAREVLHAFWLLQGVDFASDLERLLYDVLRTLNLSERQPPSHGLLRAYFGMTVMAHNMGIRPWAAIYATMASQVASALGDPLAEAIASACAAMDQYARGRYAEASRSFESARNGYRRAGDLAPWGACTAYLNLLLVAQGRLNEALPLGSELESVGRTARDRRIEAYGAHCLGGVLVWSDNGQAAGFAAFERAIAAYRAIPDHHLVLSAVGDLARARLRYGDVVAARSLVEEGTAIAKEHSLRGWWLTPLLTAEASLIFHAASDRAWDARLMSRAEQICRRLGGQVRLHAEARPSARRAFGELEWHRGREHAAHRAWEESIASARAMGVLTEELETYRTVARLARTPASVAAVESISAQVNASLRLG